MRCSSAGSSIRSLGSGPCTVSPTPACRRRQGRVRAARRSCDRGVVLAARALAARAAGRADARRSDGRAVAAMAQYLTRVRYWDASRSAERLAALEVALGVDEVAVALDVAAAAAHDEHDQVVVARVREAARGRRLDVDDGAGAERPLLA